MEHKVEGYTIAQLEKLGDEVGIVGGGVSIEGNARMVGRIFLALGLFGDVVKSLKKFAPSQTVEPISDELRVQGRLLGLSDADMDRMRAEGSGVPQFQTILPTEDMPFGFVFPVGDEIQREHSLRQFNWMLVEFSSAVYEREGKHGNQTILNVACKRMEAYWLSCKEFMKPGELEMAFNGVVNRYGQSLHRHNTKEV